MLNDGYSNYVQILLPFLVASGMGVSKGAFLISAFTFTSSVLQPVSGYLVDQKNQRWLVYVGTLWMAALLGLVGIIKNYPLLFITVALAGLGSSAFHPQASAMVAQISGNRKGFFQAFFIASGNFGWALTPLIVVPYIQRFGMESTITFILPGILVSILLWFTAPTVTGETRVSQPSIWSASRTAWLELTKVVLVVSARSLFYFGLGSFLPLYLQHQNISLLTSSRLLFLMLFSGAVGGLLGGIISDFLGRKAVIVGSLVMSSPLFYLFLVSSGHVRYLFLALSGICLLASFSVTIVVAQEVFSKNAAMASGFTLGLGIGIGGLGTGLVGMLIEYTDIVFAMHLFTWLPLLAGIFGLSLQADQRCSSTNSQL